MVNRSTADKRVVRQLYAWRRSEKDRLVETREVLTQRARSRRPLREAVDTEEERPHSDW